jgi:hypothetical protein
MHDHIFQNSNAPAAGGADGVQQVDHAQDDASLAQHEDASYLGMLDDCTQRG